MPFLIKTLLTTPNTAIIRGIYLLGIKSRLFFITYPTQRHMAITTGSAKPAINCKSINTPPHL